MFSGGVFGELAFGSRESVARSGDDGFSANPSIVTSKIKRLIDCRTAYLKNKLPAMELTEWQPGERAKVLSTLLAPSIFHSLRPK